MGMLFLLPPSGPEELGMKEMDGKADLLLLKKIYDFWIARAKTCPVEIDLKLTGMS